MFPPRSKIKSVEIKTGIGLSTQLPRNAVSCKFDDKVVNVGPQALAKYMNIEI